MGVERDNVLVKFRLTPAAVDAMSRAAQLEEHTRTDTLNRALQVYAFLLEQIHVHGREIHLYDRETGDFDILRIL